MIKWIKSFSSLIILRLRRVGVHASKLDYEEKNYNNDMMKNAFSLIFDDYFLDSYGLRWELIDRQKGN